jgi:hypothetical protein
VVCLSVILEPHRRGLDQLGPSSHKKNIYLVIVDLEIKIQRVIYILCFGE